MIVKGTVQWADGRRFRIVISNGKFKTDLSVYSDSNPDQLKENDEVEIVIRKVSNESKGSLEK